MRGATPVRRAAVLGTPIAHSLSPALHRAAYRALRLTGWRYEAVECDESGLRPLLEACDDSWAGLSLTMPLKRAVLPLLDEVSELAAAVGGVNTVVFTDGRRVGYNTDIGGVARTLRTAGITRPASVQVLGAGATACSVLAALRDFTPEWVEVFARDLSRTAGVRGAADRLGVRVRFRTWDEITRLLRADLVVSTVPAGATDTIASGMRELAEATAGRATVFDVVYAPWPSKLAVAAEAARLRVIGGFPMLLYQAARQVELMTGREPAPLAAMRAAGEAELARRALRAP